MAEARRKIEENYTDSSRETLYEIAEKMGVTPEEVVIFLDVNPEIMKGLLKEALQDPVLAIYYLNEVSNRTATDLN